MDNNTVRKIFYYKLADDEVAHALEAVALIAERRTHTATWANPTRQRLRFARCCYGHLAGQLGVELFSQLLSKEWLAPVSDGYLLTTDGKTGLDAIGFAVDGMDKAPPSSSVAYRCLDWSERRDHMAGKLPKALLAHCLQQGWLRRFDGERALQVTPLARVCGADTYTPLAGAAFLVLPSEADIVAAAGTLA